ncbi:uncharacterized protein LOC121998603 [Zingiber officinale]|uniref:DUF7963 domain-containing protein n=1 Tax=Zingiber officinale TaxID=94328 RepID=A0A8J5G7Z1_ZINOF|nr:uncharacterized protein LOC121998603 [Zingiber officinale]KAG6502203.1 hypothetical protein ZIOFF_042092 [Zingiber officinale]
MEAEVKEVAGDEGVAEGMVAGAARKRYERLVAVRSKATRGKGAWYWAHLEPVMVVTPAGVGQAAETKLRCGLCSALFSASNPSRTASEHLKRGGCPNFSLPCSAAVDPLPISSLPPASPRRCPLAMRWPALPPPPLTKPALVLSGGKEDLVALARLEDSVKKLKSPMAAPAAALPKPQADAALALLADWILESGVSVSPSSLDHPKFRSFLNQVGLPSVSSRRLILSQLHARYLEVLSDSEARIHDAAFFQLSSDGWKSSATSSDHAIVSFAVNLPNGKTLFHRSILTVSRAPSSYAEEVMRDAVAKLCEGFTERCAGIVADRFKKTALRNLESRNERMVNLSCQLEAFNGLIKDFAQQLPLFRKVSGHCLKLANFINVQSQVRRIFLRYQLEEHGHARLPRTASIGAHRASDELAVVEDVMEFARPIRMAALDEDYKLVYREEQLAGEMAELIQNGGFWSELESVHSLVKLVTAMAHEIELERPLIGQCLPLWDELRTRVREWGVKHGMNSEAVEKLIETRFSKNYHPAWSAAFVLDPLFLIKDAGGKCLPPFKRLSPEQDKDVGRLITRSVSPEEAHIALMELMKWRSEGLDPFYAQAVQAKQRDPSTGKMKVANPQSRRLVWETCLSEFKCLQKIAVRLVFLHATSCGIKRDSSLMRWMHVHAHSEVPKKMAFLTAHSTIAKMDSFTETMDVDVPNMADDDALGDFADASSAL